MTDLQITPRGRSLPEQPRADVFTYANGGESEDLLTYARMVWDRRLIALAVFLVVTGGAVVYCFTATPTFEARAQLLIEPDAPNVVSFQEVLEEEAGKADYYLTQFQILQSRTLAASTLETMKLWDHREFQAREDPFAWARGLFGGTFRPAEIEIEEGTATPGQLQAIGRFLQRLTIEPIRNSRLVNIRFRSSDPVLSADVVNTLVRLYIDRSKDLKPVASKEALAWLDTELAKQREVVREQERALQQFRDQNDALGLEGGQNVVTQRLAELNLAATRARTARIEKESRYEQLEGFDIDDALATPAGALGPAVEALRGGLTSLQVKEAELAAQLGDQHPDLVAARVAVTDMERRIAAEVGRYRAALYGDLLAARSNEQRLAAAFEAQKAEVLARDRQALEYSSLRREATSSRELLESLLQRANEIAVAGNLKLSNVSIVDSASVPMSTVYPRKQIVVGVAGVVGLLLGLGVALACGYTDTRFKSPEQVTRQLDLQLLGCAPLLPRSALKHGPLVMHNGVPSAFAEALRIVRTNVAVERESGGPRVLLVTSAREGEGKTLIAINLATALAQARQRVLLVDGDMRQPGVHDAFDQPLEPGLSDFLIDPAAAGPAIRETSIAGLKILPAGAPAPNPADLLGFEPATQIATSLGADFDWIVIDSPPVGEVTDACLFARGSARVLFVVAANGVTRSDARAAVERLAAADASFAGAVLSRVTAKTFGDYGRTAA